jgi:zinc transport system substrate-binding protein
MAMRPFGSGTFALSFLLALVVGCGGEDGTDPPDTRPVVVASIFPVGDLTRSMVGELARVEVMLPPGASPATFDVTPRQLRDLHDAGLFVMIGGGLDEWAATVPATSGSDARILRLSDGIPLLAGEPIEHEGHTHEGAGNPHIWLDPILVRDQLLPKLQESLTQLLPQGAEAIAERTAGLADSLSALDAEIREILAPLEKRSFVVTHPAWSYYALRYGLNEVGVIHTHPGHEPSSREMAALLDAALEHEIECLFVEPQIGEVAVRALAVELSLPTCLVDPLGGPVVEGRDGYLSLLRFNTRQLAEGLEGTFQGPAGEGP